MDHPIKVLFNNPDDPKNPQERGDYCRLYSDFH